MKFIKGIMGRKQPVSDTVNIEDVAAMIDDVEAEEPANAEIFNNLAAIQSKLKGLQSDSDNPEELALEPQDDLASASDDNAGQVANFEDLVAEIKPAPANGAAPNTSELATDDPKTELAPIMTEDDFTQLDEELAKLSDDLVNTEAQIPPNETAEEAPVKPVAIPESAAVEKDPTIAEQPMDPVAKSEELASEPIKAPSVFAPPPGKSKANEKRQNTMHISEQMGGASEPEPKSEMSEKEAAIRSILTSPAKTAEPDTETEMVAPETDTNTEKVESELHEAQPEPEVEEKVQTVEPDSMPNIVAVPAPAAGRARRRAGRVKTRLLGFEHANGTQSDPFDAENETAASTQVNFPVGWIAVIEGPGLGTAFAIFNGVSKIGRGDDQPIKLDFGDSSISRDNHAAIAYDAEQHTFFLGHGGKANLVRLNDKPVLSTEEIANNDIIRIGETKLRFVALCGPDFNWDTEAGEDSEDAAIA